MKLLIDTNVLIDYLSRRQPYFEGAKLLRQAALFGDVDIWCSVQSFTDAEYILRGAIPIDALRKMMDNCLSFIKPVSPPSSELHSGFVSGWPYLEDFLIAACAERVGADYIITRDRQGFTNSKIPALSPEELFERMATDYGITYDEVDFSDVSLS